MSFDDITEFETEFSQGKLKVRIMDMPNGLLVMLSESDAFRLGQSAVAIPPGQGRAEPTSAGLFSTGIDSTPVRTLAERIAAFTNKTAMVIVGLKELTQAVMMEIVLILKNHFLV